METSLNTNLSPQNLPNPQIKPDIQASEAEKAAESYLYSRVSVDYQLTLTGAQSTEKLTYSRYQVSTTVSNATEVDAAAPVSEPQEPLLEGAKTILDFIQQRIASESAAGADGDAIASLLQQGLSGFLQGFEEAKGLLQGSGELSGVVNDEISLLYNQVLDGLRSLADQYDVALEVPENINLETVPSAPKGATNTPTAGLNSAQSSGEIDIFQSLKKLNSEPQGHLKTLMDTLDAVDTVREAQVSYARKDRFSFQLTTQDGDTVRIDAKAMTAYYGDYQSNGQNEQLVEGMKEKSQFNLHINGELDEQEQTAINELLTQILSLADDFYNGDIDKAYEAALELGYDDSQIASYSLRLKQTTQVSVAALYPENAAQNMSPSAEGRDVLSTIGDFSRQVLETLAEPANYKVADYRQLLEIIASQLDQQLAPSEYPFNRAIQGLTEHLQTLGILSDMPV